MKTFLTVVIAGLSTLSSCAQQSPATDKIKKDNNHMTTQPNTAIATFANGCFWCTEAIFEELNGVIRKITFDELLEVFWQTHDPTTLNRQGADVGTQYRSGIFYHNSEQKEKAEKYKTELDKSGAFNNPIVTEITAFSKFYPAEDYHQQYYELNGNNNPYCKIVIQPKLEKFRKVFKNKLKLDE
ncbi:MAG: peptide-methionine (S)-S-oxide reductase MsrA [Chitinophagaceae bacterium]|nr:peptide-methionine (S)-S-oxide reductase MsrA [Chitinophagaceae bacterium]